MQRSTKRGHVGELFVYFMIIQVNIDHFLPSKQSQKHLSSCTLIYSCTLTHTKGKGGALSLTYSRGMDDDISTPSTGFDWLK